MIPCEEIDPVLGPRARDNGQTRSLPDLGHRRGAVTGRGVVRGKVVETEVPLAVCAETLAGLGVLPDTVLTRSVIVRVRRSTPGDRVAARRRRVHGSAGHSLVWVGAGGRDDLHLAHDLAALRRIVPSGICLWCDGPRDPDGRHWCDGCAARHADGMGRTA